MRWIAVLVAGSQQLAFAPAAQAQPDLTVRVTIDKVDAVDGFEGGGAADFYASSRIDGGPESVQGPVTDDNTADPDPDWMHGRSVDAARGRVPLSIEIRDRRRPSPRRRPRRHRPDERRRSLQPRARGQPRGVREPDLLLRRNAVSGDGDEQCGQFARPRGRPAATRPGSRYKIEVFEGDLDGDFLPDSWEAAGIDADNDRTVDLSLPNLGARVDRKDVFVEIDCLVAANHSHCPRWAR